MTLESLVWMSSGNRCSSDFEGISTIYMNRPKNYSITID